MTAAVTAAVFPVSFSALILALLAMKALNSYWPVTYQA
jgi:hypothetical protein